MMLILSYTFNSLTDSHIEYATPSELASMVGFQFPNGFSLNNISKEEGEYYTVTFNSLTDSH